MHVERDDQEAKFWLDPLEIARTGGMSQRDINYVLRIIEEQRLYFLERWDEFFPES